MLTDTRYIDGKSITKKKLIRLDPKRLFWSNTHLTGPNKHSQFLYQIVSLGAKSTLEFTGLEVNYSKAMVSQKKIKSMEGEAREEDSAIWKKLAKSMEKDLKL